MALSADKIFRRRGQPATAGEFGYFVAAGVKVYRGALIAINAAGNIVLVGAGTAVAFVGIADRFLDNSAGSGVSAEKVVGLRGTWDITVPSATPTNTNAAVYATDDGTATLTASTNLQIGTLAGIESSQTWVKLL